MRRLLAAFCLLMIHLTTRAQFTRFEETGGKETATYAEAIQWYNALALTSKIIKIKTFGSTDAGYPLHLVMMSNDKKFGPTGWHRAGKVVIMINNGIHPGEPDGIDASMMLVRDIITKKVALPGNVVLAFIPVYNIGGALNRGMYTRANQNGPLEYGFRGNSQNLDLNRDFTKGDSREAVTFANIFHFLKPNILIDNHVSDGADYQHTMTLISTQYDKLGDLLGPWLRDKFEPGIYAGMSKKNWDLIPYVDFDRTNFENGMKMFYDPPRYSSGYAAMFNCIAFMPETHMLKPYKDRVQATYDLMVTFIEQASKNAAELMRLKREAEMKELHKKSFALKWVSDANSYKTILFKGYERDTIISNATGLPKMFYNHSKPYSRTIKYFNHFEEANIVAAPRAYVIPQGWYIVIEKLRSNGITCKQFKADTIINVTTYSIDSYKSLTSAYEKHHKNYNVVTTTSRQATSFRKGDYYVSMEQPGKRYIVEMLEPTGEDSFFAWNYFDGILQQKEGYSDYRWEDIAAGVLKQDSALKEKLDQKKLSDPAFAKNSAAILDYIYKNSPYFEKAYLVYPVSRVN